MLQYGNLINFNKSVRRQCSGMVAARALPPPLQSHRDRTLMRVPEDTRWQRVGPLVLYALRGFPWGLRAEALRLPNPASVGAVAAVADDRGAPGRPTGAAHFIQKFAYIIVQGGEKVPPTGVYTVRIFKIFGVYFRDEGGVGAIQKRSLFDKAAHLSSAAFCHVLQWCSASYGRCVVPPLPVQRF